MEKKIVLEVRNLSTSFRQKKKVIPAVDGVSFHLAAGEMLGIVGESGCGKSVTSQSVMRLYDEREDVTYEGEVLLNGRDILKLPFRKMQEIRGREIAMIFQDALTSLNPVYTVEFQLVEAIRMHQKMDKKQAKVQALALLQKVGISDPEKRMKQYPHELSGGMRQRVMTAIALSCKPDVLIADEPTTALDVTIQAQIMEMIRSLKDEDQVGVILITHDMGVVAENCDRVAVMYLGQIVETAPVAELFAHPRHPYTKGLMKAIPQMDGDREEDLYAIEGTLPELAAVQGKCRFADRCPYASDRCMQGMPQMEEISDGHFVRCYAPLA